MRRSRIAGLLLVSMAALAQQQPVEITSEPRHHLVFENEYVRVFDVTVEPKGSTLVHRHRYDYLFVTLGDSDVVSARPGEKPFELSLEDGEIRFTPGNFSHAAINRSDRPFHNITIELLRPSSNVKSCREGCGLPPDCSASGHHCTIGEKRISSDHWSVRFLTMPPSSSFSTASLSGPCLLIAVDNLNLTRGGSGGTIGSFKRQPGGLEWISAGLKETIANDSPRRQALVILEFTAEKQIQ
jgi:hypothetical protein